MPTPTRDPSWPSWYQSEDEEASPQSQAPAGPQPPVNSNAPMPSWYTPEEPPETAVVTADKPDSPIGDFISNTATGVARVPGAIIGTPHTLVHAADWALAQLWKHTLGSNPNLTGEPALPATKLEPFLRSPSFKKALGAANGAVLDEGGEPLTKYFAFDDGDDTPSYLSGEAVPPDVLQPYSKSIGNLSYWFPNLAQKFSTVKAAQNTLETIQAQKGIVDAVGSGALRDNNGIVTGPSFNKWLATNKDALGRTQSPTAVMRLQSIASALQGADPGQLADMVKSELAPAGVGMMLGGLEGGVLGTLLHKTTQAAFGNMDAKRMAAFSTAIEKATIDPDYAARLTANAAKQGRGMSPTRALIRAIGVTPLALNSGRGDN